MTPSIFSAVGLLPLGLFLINPMLPLNELQYERKKKRANVLWSCSRKESMPRSAYSRKKEVCKVMRIASRTPSYWNHFSGRKNEEKQTLPAGQCTLSEGVLRTFRGRVLCDIWKTRPYAHVGLRWVVLPLPFLKQPSPPSKPKRRDFVYVVLFSFFKKQIFTL